MAYEGMRTPRDYARLHDDWFNDPVLADIGDRQPGVACLWPILVALAKRCSHHADNPNGIINTTDGSLVRASMRLLDADQILGCLHELVEAEMIDLKGTAGDRLKIRLNQFDKWQVPKGSNAERQQAHRDTLQGKSTVKSRSVTTRNRSVTHTNTNTNTNNDKESKVPPFSKEEKKAAPIAQVKELFEHWKTMFGRNGNTVLDDKRKRCIQRAIKTYGMDTARTCLDGYAKDDWPDRSKHSEITLLFRDAEHIERGLALADPTRKPPTTTSRHKGDYRRTANERGIDYDANIEYID